MKTDKIFDFIAKEIRRGSKIKDCWKLKVYWLTDCKSAICRLKIDNVTRLFK